MTTIIFILQYKLVIMQIIGNWEVVSWTDSIYVYSTILYCLRASPLINEDSS